MVERLAAPQRPPAPEQSQERHKSARPTVFATTTTETRKCIICKGSHHVESYQQFQGIPLEKRASNVKKHLLCFSCLTQAIAKKIVGRKRHVRLTNAKESIILSCMVLHLLFHQRKPLSLHPPEQLSSKFPASRQEAL